MNILVSNDDGIAANGIRVLTEELSQHHNVYVVAPDRERSAAGHSLTLHTPLRVEELDTGKNGAKRTWVTTGTPGDCVKIGINAILAKEEQPDFVISGINHGPNLGADILYSGTVSCAMEGAMLGVPSIAVSLASMTAEYEDFKFGAKFMVSLLEKLKDFKFPPKSILNVNIPKLDAEDIMGVAITELGRKMFTDAYEKRIDPRGKVYYWMAGELINEPVDAPTDIGAVRNNKISITPVTYEMTRTETISYLDKVLCSSGACNWY
jgi:5'-nucleotidase